VVLIGLLKGLEVLRVSFPVKQVLVAAFLLLLCLPAVAAPMVLPTEEASQMMPDKLGDFRATGAVRVSELNLFGKESPEDFNAYSSATRTYTSTKGGTFILTLIRTRSDPGAYALLSRYAAEMRSKGETLAKTDRVGTVGFATGRNNSSSLRVLSQTHCSAKRTIFRRSSSIFQIGRQPPSVPFTSSATTLCRRLRETAPYWMQLIFRAALKRSSPLTIRRNW
jgi:hypothetical protein